MIVAGEASGDRLGADLVKAIVSKTPGASFFGAAGPAMRSAGVESVYDSNEWSVVGVGAVMRSIPRFLKIMSELRDVAKKRKPAAVILIDFPEFNLNLAKKLKKEGHRVIYYVSPQVWAWRKYRVRTMQKSVDLILSILPFEKEWYAGNGVEHVKFVGNPVAERTKPTKSKESFLNEYGLDPKMELVALLPGSRRKEIERHLPVMLKAADLLTQFNGSVQFAVAAANSIARELIEKQIGKSSSVSVIDGDTVNLLSASDAAAISSGTATLEAGILGTPMVVVYRLPKLDYLLFRPFVKVPHVALINLIAGRRIVEEFIQHELTSENLVAELERLLKPSVNNALRTELRSVAKDLVSLSPPGRAADAVITFLRMPLTNDLQPGDRTLKKAV